MRTQRRAAAGRNSLASATNPGIGCAATWIALDVERSEDYPARRNEPEQQMLPGLAQLAQGHPASQMRGLGCHAAGPTAPERH